MMRIFSWIPHFFSWIKRFITGESRQDRKFTPQMRRKLQEALVFLPETGSVSEMTYAAVMEYFVTDRPDNKDIVRGAILLQRSLRLEGVRLVQVFLDKDLNIVCGSDGRPYGRKMVANKLNRELRDAFGDKNLIIVE
jgi:hypothetical protein